MTIRHPVNRYIKKPQQRSLSDIKWISRPSSMKTSWLLCLSFFLSLVENRVFRKLLLMSVQILYKVHVSIGALRFHWQITTHFYKEVTITWEKGKILIFSKWFFSKYAHLLKPYITVLTELVNARVTKTFRNSMR